MTPPAYIRNNRNGKVYQLHATHVNGRFRRTYHYRKLDTCTKHIEVVSVDFLNAMRYGNVRYWVTFDHDPRFPKVDIDL